MRATVMVICSVLAGCEPPIPHVAPPAAPLPHVVDRGGPRMVHPQLVTIFFADDPDAATLTEFARWVVQSSWLTEAGADYGVARGTLLGAVTLTRDAPDKLSDDEIADLVYAGLADGSLPRPASGNLRDVLYLVNAPIKTVVSTDRETSCLDFGGYHDAERRNGVELLYAVVPTCHGFYRGATDLEARELVTSHELIEAATDPFPANRPAFQLADPTSTWLALGREVGDLCARGDLSMAWREAGFVAQRVWSNTAAAHGDPCVPAPPELPYFNTAVDSPSLLRIRPGSDATLQLTGWATAAIGDWELAAVADKPDLVHVSVGADHLGADRQTALHLSVPATTAIGSWLRLYVYSTASRDDYQLLPIRAIVDEPCATFTSCDTCTAHSGCGFCGSTGRCEAQAAVGSADSSCPAVLFAVTPGACPGTCAHASSCGACTAVRGCGWCNAAATRGCVEASDDRSHPAHVSCDDADWSPLADYCSGS